jgi:DNA-nicking Smr family endonuclease
MAKRDSKRRPVLEDWHLWHEVTRSVRPLSPHRKITVSEPHCEPGSAIKGAKIRTAGGAPVHPAPAAKKLGPPPTDRLIEPRLRQKLVRGRLPIDATIDLHGMRQSEAHAALNRFIKARAARGDRTVLVITGKGLTGSDDPTRRRGVLRTMLPIWLGEGDLAILVSGYESSARPHGGEGAFYVRLKRAAP